MPIDQEVYSELKASGEFEEMDLSVDEVCVGSSAPSLCVMTALRCCTAGYVIASHTALTTAAMLRGHGSGRCDESRCGTSVPSH